MKKKNEIINMNSYSISAGGWGGGSGSYMGNDNNWGGGFGGGNGGGGGIMRNQMPGKGNRYLLQNT